MLSTTKHVSTHIVRKRRRCYGLAYALTPIVWGVDFQIFRETLKNMRLGKTTLRLPHKIGRPTVSKMTTNVSKFRTPVNAQTIKNIEDGLARDPGIVTISRIVESMGVALSAFFAEIEERQKDRLQLTKTLGDTATLRAGRAPSHEDHDVRSAASGTSTQERLLDEALADLAPKRVADRLRPHAGTRRKTTTVRKKGRAAGTKAS